MDESLAIHAFPKLGLARLAWVLSPAAFLPRLLYLVVLDGLSRVINVDLLVAGGLGVDYNADDDDD
jgi:hypothetical protein